jgi:hypothetical protein
MAAGHKTFLEISSHVYIMAILIKPPPIKFKTDRSSKKYWTIHHNANNVFGLTAEPKTLVVGFARQNDAIMTGRIIENHFNAKKEWPDFREFPEITLQGGTDGPLDFLIAKQWEFDDLKIWCALNCLDLISVERMSKKHVNSATWQLAGNRYGFDAPTELYQERFEELFKIE